MAAPTNAAKRKFFLPTGSQWYGPRPAGAAKSQTSTIEGELVMQIVRIRLDLAKYVFEVHGVDSHGKIVVRKTLRRDAVSIFFLLRKYSTLPR
jgi:hypothetical protein